MTVVVIVAVGVLTAIVAAWYSMRHHGEMPMDPDREGRRLDGLLRGHPRLAAFVARRLDPTSAGGLLLTLSLTAIFVLALVAGWVFDTLDADAGFARFDESVAEWGAANATETTTALLKLVTDLGGTTFIVAVTAAAAAWGWWRYRSPSVAVYLVTVAVTQSLVNNGLKWLVDRDRPDVAQITGLAGSSFPSGHSAAAAATYAAIALALGLRASPRTRALLGAASAAIAVSVAATRALLGVHWLTDVIAGLAVGWLCFLAVSVAFGGRLMSFGRSTRAAAASASTAASTADWWTDRGAAATPEPGAAADETGDESGRGRAGGWPLTADGARRIATVGLALFGMTVAVGLLITRVLMTTPVGDVDVRTSRWFESIRTSRLNVLTDVGSAFSDTSTIVVALAVLVPVLFLATRRWHEPLLVAGAVAMETLVFVTAGAVVGRERPPVEQLDTSPPTASFPSGHTGAAVAFYIALLVLVLWWIRHRGLRIGVGVLLAAVPVVVALSRLYRGMHYLTDVTFGAIVGLVSVAVFASVLRPPDRGTGPGGNAFDGTTATTAGDRSGGPVRELRKADNAPDGQVRR